MAYADYQYYTSEYYGSALASTEFPAMAERASDYIDYLTRGKATDTVPIKKATCALAEAFATIEKAKAATLSENGELASQSVGAYSVSYRSGAETAASYEKELYNIAARYLANTGLLYRGGCKICMHRIP